jgi:hypothetical protein
MKNASELLRDADPVRNEPELSQERREVQRRAVLAAAARVQGCDHARVKSRARLLTVLAAIVVLGSFATERMWSPLIGGVHASVRFEVRLAEEMPTPGLRESKIVGTDRSIYLHQEVVVTNADISAARSVSRGSYYSIMVEFKASGAEKMRAATEGHIGRPVAILLDGQVIMAPVLRSPIDVSAEITGRFTKAEAERLVRGIIGT